MHKAYNTFAGKGWMDKSGCRNGHMRDKEVKYKYVNINRSSTLTYNTVYELTAIIKCCVWVFNLVIELS